MNSVKNATFKCVSVFVRVFVRHASCSDEVVDVEGRDGVSRFWLLPPALRTLRCVLDQEASSLRRRVGVRGAGRGPQGTCARGPRLRGVLSTYRPPPSLARADPFHGRTRRRKLYLYFW